LYGGVKGRDAFIVCEVALEEGRVVLHVVISIFDIDGHDVFGYCDLALFTE
jgi:hypothetical protein